MEKQASVVITLDKPRVDKMLDLQAVPPRELWERIAPAMQTLDQEREGRWRLKILVEDSLEAAAELPHLVTRLHHAGIRHDSLREPGGIQGMILTPVNARHRTAA